MRLSGLKPPNTRRARATRTLREKLIRVRIFTPQIHKIHHPIFTSRMATPHHKSTRYTIPTAPFTINHPFPSHYAITQPPPVIHCRRGMGLFARLPSEAPRSLSPDYGITHSLWVIACMRGLTGSVRWCHILADWLAFCFNCYREIYLASKRRIDCHPELQQRWGVRAYGRDLVLRSREMKIRKKMKMKKGGWEVLAERMLDRKNKQWREKEEEREKEERWWRLKERKLWAVRWF